MCILWYLDSHKYLDLKALMGLFRFTEAIPAVKKQNTMKVDKYIFASSTLLMFSTSTVQNIKSQRKTKVSLRFYI